MKTLIYTAKVMVLLILVMGVGGYVGSTPDATGPLVAVAEAKTKPGDYPAPSTSYTTSVTHNEKPTSRVIDSQNDKTYSWSATSQNEQKSTWTTTHNEEKTVWSTNTDKKPFEAFKKDDTVNKKTTDYTKYLDSKLHKDTAWSVKETKPFEAYKKVDYIEKKTPVYKQSYDKKVVKDTGGWVAFKKDEWRAFEYDDRSYDDDDDNYQRSKTARCTFFTIDAYEVAPRETVTLRWETDHATRVSINQGVGRVTADGSMNIDVPATPGIYEYVLTFDDKTSYSCRDTIKVVDDPDPDPVQPICEGVSFRASDTSVNEGSDVTLRWSWTQDYDRVRVSNGIGTVYDNDRVVVNVDTDETYDLTVTRDGVTRTCATIDIDVERSSGGSSSSGSSAPRCQSFTVSDDYIVAGNRVVLRWETSRADEITLYEGTMRSGDKLFYTDDEDTVEEGVFVVRPLEDMTYTLHLERGSRDRTCTVEVEVEPADDYVTVLTNGGQDPYVAGIALADAPYTGFGGTTALAIMFYGLLAVWGSFVAYSFMATRRRPETAPQYIA